MLFGTATDLRPLLFALSAAGICCTAANSLAQQAQVSSGYPQRDILSPFRVCEDISAPPEQQFQQLRIMRAAAQRSPGHSFDDHGHPVIDDEQWHTAKQQLGLVDAGHLAQVIRTSRNADDRALALWGAIYCPNPTDVFNLIAHIPGEPVRSTREAVLPRAIAYLEAQLGRTYGDLTPQQQAALNLPEPGSPAAKRRGITRAPLATDLLFGINLQPFFQLLDLNSTHDQAQALWFLNQCFALRPDLTLAWLEPALPRIRQLLIGSDPQVRIQAMDLLRTIGPADLQAPPIDAEEEALLEFAKQATDPLFPPIRRPAEGLFLLFPGPERDALVAAGKKALQEGVGSSGYGKTKNGHPYRGLRIERVPADLAILEIPAGAVITAVNGVPIRDEASLQSLFTKLFQTRDKDGKVRDIANRRLMVEYVIDGEVHATEYRVI